MTPNENLSTIQTGIYANLDNLIAFQYYVDLYKEQGGNLDEILPSIYDVATANNIDTEPLLNSIYIDNPKKKEAFELFINSGKIRVDEYPDFIKKAYILWNYLTDSQKLDLFNKEFANETSNPTTAKLSNIKLIHEKIKELQK